MLESNITMRAAYKDEQYKLEVYNICMSDDYDQYVSLAKGKYYYECLETNYKGQLLYQQTMRTADVPIETKINEIPSLNVFFPHECLNATAGEDYADHVLFYYCVCYNIRTYLKQFLPIHLKKQIKQVGYFDRIVMDINDFVSNHQQLIKAASYKVFELKPLNKVYDFNLNSDRVHLIGLSSGVIKCRKLTDEYRIVRLS